MPAVVTPAPAESVPVEATVAGKRLRITIPNDQMFVQVTDVLKDHHVTWAGQIPEVGDYSSSTYTILYTDAVGDMRDMNARSRMTIRLNDITAV